MEYRCTRCYKRLGEGEVIIKTQKYVQEKNGREIEIKKRVVLCPCGGVAIPDREYIELVKDVMEKADNVFNEKLRLFKLLLAKYTTLRKKILSWRREGFLQLPRIETLCSRINEEFEKTREEFWDQYNDTQILLNDKPLSVNETLEEFKQWASSRITALSEKINKLARYKEIMEYHIEHLLRFIPRPDEHPMWFIPNVTVLVNGKKIKGNLYVTDRRMILGRVEIPLSIAIKIKGRKVKAGPAELIFKENVEEYIKEAVNGNLSRDISPLEREITLQPKETFESLEAAWLAGKITLKEFREKAMKIKQRVLSRIRDSFSFNDSFDKWRNHESAEVGIGRVI